MNLRKSIRKSIHVGKMAGIRTFDFVTLHAEEEMGKEVEKIDGEEEENPGSSDLRRSTDCTSDGYYIIHEPRRVKKTPLRDVTNNGGGGSEKHPDLPSKRLKIDVIQSDLIGDPPTKEQCRSELLSKYDLVEGLDEHQSCVFQYIMDKHDEGQLLMVVQGEPGTGRSLIIRKLREQLYEDTYQICAVTGNAAKNVEGVTIDNLDADDKMNEHVIDPWIQWVMCFDFGKPSDHKCLRNLNKWIEFPLLFTDCDFEVNCGNPHLPKFYVENDELVVPNNDFPFEDNLREYPKSCFEAGCDSYYPTKSIDLSHDCEEEEPIVIEESSARKKMVK